MIWIDDREGGAEKGETRTGSLKLKELFESHRFRPTATVQRLPAADIAFPGEGDKGPCMIGIERKSLKGLLSDKRTGRLVGEQLPKLLDHYETCFLIIEDRFRTNWTTGNLEMPWGREWREVILGDSAFLAMELESFLFTLMFRTPLKIIYTSNVHETVEQALSIQHYFAKSPSTRHDHLALHVPQPAVTIGKASTVRRWAFQLQGVGWERSMAAETRFIKSKVMKVWRRKIDLDPVFIALRVGQRGIGPDRTAIDGQGKLAIAQAFINHQGVAADGKIEGGATRHFKIGAGDAGLDFAGVPPALAGIIQQRKQ